MRQKTRHAQPIPLERLPTRSGQIPECCSVGPPTMKARTCGAPCASLRRSSVVEREAENSHHSPRRITRRRTFFHLPLSLSTRPTGQEPRNPRVRGFMACSFPPSSATRLQAVDAAAVKNARVPLKASVSPAARSLGSCKAARQEFEGATQDPNFSGTACQLPNQPLIKVSSLT